MKLIFAGTPEFAAQALQGIVDAGHEVALVLTQPDRPAGRGMTLQPSAVKKVALEHGIEVFQPLTLKDAEAQAKVAAVGAEVMVVAAYGLILPQVVLDMPRLGCINIHGSLLPRWRGAAPIQRALLAGDAETGVCIMQMEAGLDTGPVLLRGAFPIEATDTTATLHDRLAELGAKLVVEALGKLPFAGRAAACRGGELRPQDRKGGGADRLEQECRRTRSSHSCLQPLSPERKNEKNKLKYFSLKIKEAS